MNNSFNIVTLIQGFGIGMGLIVAIGPQNAFVLKQGLKRHYLFLTASVCSFIDTAFILLGVAGFGTLVSSHPLFIEIARWFGALFLLWFGFKSFRAALHKEILDVKTVKQSGVSVKQTVLVLLALSLLNPHMYLDTIVFIGSIASQYPAAERYWFALGTIIASFTWFFSLSYGAKILNPLFKKPIAWKVLDVVIGIIMCTIALTLVFH